jgi:tetratricopeptide (TPR) repeat protein
VDEKIDYYLRGKTKAELGMDESAVKDLTKAIELDPEAHLAYYQRGLIFIKLEEEHKALADFKMAITINPDFEEALEKIILIEHAGEDEFPEEPGSNEVKENEKKNENDKG